jgi:hypothetical protein
MSDFISRSLDYGLAYPVIVHAAIKDFDAPDGGYYYTVTVDYGTTDSTQMGSRVSRIFQTYDETVVAMNVYIGETVAKGLLPA